MDSKRRALIVYATTFAIALLSSLYVLHGSLSLATSYSEVYVSDEIYYVDSARRIMRDVFGASVREASFSNRTAADYYNLEHPPLGKYFIALAISVSDSPLCWRMPSAALAALIPLLLYATYASRGPLGAIAGASASIAAAADPILRVMGSVAMLDMYLAFFTALSMAFAYNGRHLLSLLFAALSLNVKISGIGTLLGSLMSLYHVESLRERVKLALLGLAMVLAVSLAIHAPLIAHFGPDRMLHETVSALKWHTTSRPKDGPPYSNPSGWILNAAPFPLSFDPLVVEARVNTLVHLVALTAAVYYILRGITMGLGEIRIAAPLYYGAITMAYWMAFLAGNQTLYSFYAVQLSPAAAATVAELTIIAWKGEKRGT